MTLNKQKPESKSSIEWTRVWGRDGYTWNPIAGCEHQCRWTMPNGEDAICYAELIASRMAQKAYDKGFAHHYWKPQHLNSPKKLKSPSGIFVGSMSDVFAARIVREHPEQIQAILDVIADTPQHVYFMLTKNPKGAKGFNLPENVWLGASMPPDYMFGKALDRETQIRKLHVDLYALAEIDARVKWMSFEPLSWDVEPIVAQYAGVLDWAVIGAASHGRQYFAPALIDFLKLKVELKKQRVPIFFKGNMSILARAKGDWLEEFPPQSGEQLRLF